MKKLELKLPNLEFLKFANIYSSNFNEFNFKIIPNIKLNTFEIFVWSGKKCLEFSKLVANKVFNLNDEGHLKGQLWLNNEFDKFNKNI